MFFNLLFCKVTMYITKRITPFGIYMETSCENNVYEPLKQDNSEEKINSKHIISALFIT